MYGQDTYGNRNAVAWASENTRATFIKKTYLHLLGATLAFTMLEVFYFQSGMAQNMARAMLSGSWLLVLGGFMVISWIASHFAQSAKSQASQYFGLGLFVVAESIIFVPLLFIAMMKGGAEMINSAAQVTVVGFAALTAVAWFSRKDFSFLGVFLKWGFVVALILIGASLLFGFNLGTLFSVAMIALAGAAILYDTSNVLRHFPEDAYVGAALQLFASVALMFWYVLRLFMSRD
ncbi:MAG: US12 family protein [Acidobacteria bacterium]|nr:US12 family protein [Acidobacteriota bacterium]